MTYSSEPSDREPLSEEQREQRIREWYDLVQDGPSDAFEQCLLDHIANRRVRDGSRLIRELERAGYGDPSRDDTAHATEQNSWEPGVGALCGPFRIEEKIGEGGMGCVYRATRQDDLNLKVALKTLTWTEPYLVERFRKESRILAGLKHPNIVHIIDAGMLPSGRPWLAMEHVEGDTLDVYLTRERPDLKQRLALFLKICDAVSHAHQRMIIHRDLKPGNIMVLADGQPKLLDFGIAASLNPGAEKQASTVPDEQMLTPDYASPEQISGQEPGAASDVYSLGVILYLILTGRHPYRFKARTREELIRMIRETPVIRPGEEKEKGFVVRRGADLDAIVLKAMAFEVSQRYTSVEALAADLRRYLETWPVKARSHTRLYLLTRFMQRHPWPVAVSSGLALFLVLFTFYVTRQRDLIRHERDLAERQRQTAEQVTNLLVSMFEQVDPDLARGGEISALEVMESGRIQINSMLADAPEVRTRLMATMGRVYRALGDHDRSRAVLEQSLSYAEYPAKGSTELELIRTLLAGGRYLEAEQRLDALAARLEEHDLTTPARMEHARGQLRFLRGNYLMALQSYETAEQQLQQLPIADRLALRQDRAELWSALGRYAQAIDELQQLLILQQNHYGSVHSSVGQTLAALGIQHQHEGRYQEAASFFDRSESIYHEIFGDDHPKVIQCLSRRGRLFWDQGRYNEAEPVLRKALMLYREHLGNNHPMVANSLKDLGRLLHVKEDLGGAEAHYREALILYRATRGENHPDIAECLNNLALLHQSRSDFDAAESLLRKALAIYRQNPGERHPVVADSLNNLGNLYRTRSDYEMAEQLHRQSLDIYHATLGQDHPSVAIALNNIANTHRGRGDFDIAEQYYHRALDINSRHFGEDHIRLAAMRNNLALCLQAMGRYQESEELHRRSLAARTKTLGEDNPRIAISYNNLGFLLVEAGRYRDAAPFLHRALQLRKQAYNEGHRFIGLGLGNLARLYRETGDYPAAEDHFLRALEIYRTALAEPNIGIVKNLWNLADLRLKEGELERAEDLFREALTMVLELPRGNRYNLVPIHTGLAELYLIRFQDDAAADALEQACEILEERRSEQTALKVHHLQARLLHHRGDRQGARDRLHAVLARCEATLGKEHPLMAEALFDLAELLAEEGNLAEALTRIRQAAAILSDLLPPDHELHHVATSIQGSILYQSARHRDGAELMRNAHRTLSHRLGSLHHLTRDARDRLQLSAIPPLP